jgi:acyl dehydratase
MISSGINGHYGRGWFMAISLRHHAHFGNGYPTPQQSFSNRFQLPPLGHVAPPLEKTITEQEVTQFCDIVGPPMSVDHLKALAKAIKPSAEDNAIAVPGSFVMAQITRAFITMFKALTDKPVFPIYAFQNLEFKKPVFVGEPIKTQVAVKDIEYQPSARQNRATLVYTLQTDVFKQNLANEHVLTGQAKVHIRRDADPSIPLAIEQMRRRNP